MIKEDYAVLTVSSTPNAAPRVGLEQFDLQSTGTDVWAFADGWHELVFDARRGLLWRWTSDRAAIVIRPGGRDLTLKITGESPLRYFEQPPEVTVRAHEAALARFRPTGDFSEELTVPAARLARPYARLVIDTDRVFAPAERGGSADRRRLGLRIYELALR